MYDDGTTFTPGGAMLFVLVCLYVGFLWNVGRLFSRFGKQKLCDRLQTISVLSVGYAMVFGVFGVGFPAMFLQEFVPRFSWLKAHMNVIVWSGGYAGWFYGVLLGWREPMK